MQHGPNCGGGELKIIAAILERPVIEKILTHLGLDALAAAVSAVLSGLALLRHLRRPLAATFVTTFGPALSAYSAQAIVFGRCP
ncbi:MAG: hypothetical protein KF720_01295 [Rubrivivax sp.]|nr:hypothetical protein [Rubrivivax sp.]